MRNVCLALVLSLFASLPVFAQGGAAKPDSSKYYPVEQVRVGQKGYGLTIFQGNTVERFEVEILGVIDGQPAPKQKLIIGRLSGGQVERTRVFAGMSGSPVYIDGKLVGAVAYSFAFSTEPIAGITPIGQMIDQLDIPQSAPRAAGARNSFATMVASRGASGALLPAASLSTLPSQVAVPVGLAAASPTLSQYAGQSLQPIASPLAFNGIPQSVIDQVAPDFARLGIMPVAGLAGGTEMGAMQPSTSETLKPGSSITVQLIRGDFQAATAGTVTERDGEKIFAFGHPFLSIGGTEMPMSESSVVVVVPNANNSFKLVSTNGMVGSIGQDRSSGIGGKLGQAAKMIPVRVSLKRSTGQVHNYSYEIVSDPVLTPILANMTLLSTVVGYERQMGDQTLDVRGKIRLAGQAEIGLENRFSSSQNAAGSASLSVAQPLAILMNSGFRDVAVDGIDVEITASEERSVGSLTRLWVDKTRVGRGETVTIQAFARTEDGQEFVEKIPVVIPRDVPVGKLGILVGDGSSLVALDETLTSFVPENLTQLVGAINRLKKNDRLYVKLLRASGGALVDSQPLTALPPSVLSSLGSPRASGGYTALQTTTVLDHEVPPAQFVIAGQQSIIVNVVR